MSDEVQLAGARCEKFGCLVGRVRGSRVLWGDLCVTVGVEGRRRPVPLDRLLRCQTYGLRCVRRVTVATIYRFRYVELRLRLVRERLSLFHRPFRLGFDLSEGRVVGVVPELSGEVFDRHPFSGGMYLARAFLVRQRLVFRVLDPRRFHPVATIHVCHATVVGCGSLGVFRYVRCLAC